MVGGWASYRGIGMAAFDDSNSPKALAGVGWWEAAGIVIVAIALVWQWLFL